MSAASGDMTTVNRLRADVRLRECSGYALALLLMANECEDLPGHAVAAIASALMFSMERLCEEHGLDERGRRQ